MFGQLSCSPETTWRFLSRGTVEIMTLETRDRWPKQIGSANAGSAFLFQSSAICLAWLASSLPCCFPFPVHQLSTTAQPPPASVFHFLVCVLGQVTLSYLYW